MIVLRGPTTASGTTSATLTVPAGTLTGDFMLIVAEFNNLLVVPTPAGWTPLPGMPLDSGGSRMYAWTKTATAPEASVAFTGITDHIAATMFVFNGVDLSGGIAYTSNAALTAASVNVSFPSLAGSPVTPGDAVLFFSTSEVDTSTGQLSNYSLPGIDEPLATGWSGSFNTSSGGGGGLIWAGGIARTGQETGGVATLVTSSRQVKMVISLTEASDPNDYVSNFQALTVVQSVAGNDAAVTNFQVITVLQVPPAPPSSNRRRGFMSFIP